MLEEVLLEVALKGSFLFTLSLATETVSSQLPVPVATHYLHSALAGSYPPELLSRNKPLLKQKKLLGSHLK